MILDTNAVSALQAKDAKLIAQIENEPSLILNLISLGEYRFGVDGSRYRTSILQWLESLIQRSTLLSPDLGTLPHYSRIRHELKSAGTPIPANDVWIAALCRQHVMPVLSRDTHFDKVPGLLRIEW
ncbi:MAG: PIN domain-containing protein [Verrucomicrobia bacterium]|nr:PIN domain-containing protein [Verrucomicrobiota bacterium]MCH8510787.1 PIN domain-containing protein [Kiritimatiellia bacterium]